MSLQKLTLSIVSFTILTVNVAFADMEESTRAISISGGEDHTLVLTKNKFAWCCGCNYAYQLGIGEDSPDYQLTLVRVHGPDDVGHLEDINDIAAGWTHSLALDVNGFVWTWGNNVKGQLGDNQQSGHQSPTPVQVHGVNDAGYLRHIIVISAGRSGRHSLAVDANNFAYGWGFNYFGQCGNGLCDCNEYTPVRVLKGQQETSASGYLENIVAVSAGQTHSMALEKLDPCNPNCKGRVYTFGSNKWPVDCPEEGCGYPSGYGKLGNGSTANLSTTPVRVLKGEQDTSTSSYLENIVAISAGWDHCVALEDYNPSDPNCKGRVYTWGNNYLGWGNYHNPCSVGGRLGDGTYDNNSTPVRVLKGQQDTSTSNYLEHIVAIAAGEGHSMALDVNHNVYTWGDNYFGQLGNGTNDPCTRPVKVIGPDLNHNGIHEPNEGYLENIVAISAGFWHCLAIDENGNIWTWGKNADSPIYPYGQLGLGDAANRNIPHRISVVHNITQETFYFGIQNALNDANNDDIIEALIGTYYEEINFPSDKHITLRSTNPDNPSVVANTIINGSNQDSSDLITLYPNPGSTITGFTITDACRRGLACIDSSVSIENCIIQNNQYEGIELWDSTANITNCCIQNNIESGIRINGASGTTTITNNIIRCNGDYGGIYLQNVSAPTMIKNNWINNNSLDGIGIYNDNVNTSPTIRNNTDVNNAGYGINCSLSTPVISNCIIWGNTTGQLSTNCTATYSCIQGNPVYQGIGNTNADPNFMNPTDPNDFHINGSPCKNAGNPNGNYDSETDIDGEGRVKYGRVDIGGDEYYWSSADFNGDEFVNFIDYAIFAQAWNSNAGGPKWNPDCDLDANGIIDYYDLDLFCEDWLWQAGWAKSFICGAGEGMSQAMAGGFASQEAAGEVSSQSVSAEQPFDSGLRSEPQIEKVEPAEIEQMIKWLEEIWLDPEARELIDKDTWLKFIESLKEEL